MVRQKALQKWSPYLFSRIVKEAEKQMKLVVETIDTVTIHNTTEIGEKFTNFDAFLIDIMEEFRLIKTGAKKPAGNNKQ